VAGEIGRTTRHRSVEQLSVEFIEAGDEIYFLGFARRVGAAAIGFAGHGCFG
jgi:hypothetical protein